MRSHTQYSQILLIVNMSTEWLHTCYEQEDEGYRAHFFMFYTEHSDTSSGLVERWLTKTLHVGPTGQYTPSPKPLAQHILVHLATACVEIKECDCYYEDATWCSLPIVDTCSLHILTYIMTTILKFSTNIPIYIFKVILHSYTNQFTIIHCRFLPLLYLSHITDFPELIIEEDQFSFSFKVLQF